MATSASAGRIAWQEATVTGVVQQTPASTSTCG
jgi:hypothetical protein